MIARLYCLIVILTRIRLYTVNINKNIVLIIHNRKNHFSSCPNAKQQVNKNNKVFAP
jgi:hypothetical protein